MYRRGSVLFQDIAGISFINVSEIGNTQTVARQTIVITLVKIELDVQSHFSRVLSISNVVYLRHESIAR